LPAFQRALEVGAWAIELDVRFTKDGVPVINHDPDLGRLHRSDGRIEDLKFAEVQSRAPMVPTLETVLALPAHFMIELKIAATDEQVQTLAQRLAHLSPKENYHILSLRGDFFREHSALPPEAWILVGELNMTGTYREARDRNFGGVAGHYVTLTRNLIERLHSDKLVAGTGFAPSKNIFRREWNQGVDWVFTNRIADLV
jgi:glycerophosphoryl diester phosphodiesterase